VRKKRKKDNDRKSERWRGEDGRNGERIDRVRGGEEKERGERVCVCVQNRPT
jgi:hypothetical protein